MFRIRFMKPAVILVMIAVAAVFGLTNCTGKKPSTTAKPTATSMASPSIAFETTDVAVGDDTGLATEVYALKLSKSDEMIKYAGMYGLTSKQFNLIDRYNDEFYKDKVSLLLLFGGPATSRYEVKKMTIVDGKLVVLLNEVVKSSTDNDIVYRGMVVEVKSADVASAETAVVQLHMEIG